MRVAIIGAGLAGLTCAQHLGSEGLRPVLFDKGKGPSGRMATRTVKTALGDVRFDIGAQYFTAQTPRFANQVAQWAEDGVVASWPEAGPYAWVGSPSMSCPLGAMAATQDVNWNSFVGGISRKNDGWILHLDRAEEGPFDVVVIALPAEQATPLLALNESMFMLQSASSVSTPCWCGMFAFAEPLNSRRSIFRETGIVSWACRNTAKPGRYGLEAWVVQADSIWSQANLEVEQANIAEILLSNLLAMTATPRAAPLVSQAHRWRFSKSQGLGLGELWNSTIGLGVCGDWLLAPRVEGAWLSGFGLAQRILQEPVLNKRRSLRVTADHNFSA